MKTRTRADGTRRQYSPEERARLIAEYAESGLSQKAFAEERGINVGTFRQWLYRSDGKEGVGTAQEPTFQEISLGDLPSAEAWAVEISWPQGPTIRLSTAVSPAWAGELIKTLQATC